MKDCGEEVSGYMYHSRACYYGHTESCIDLKKPRETYSKKGLEFLKEVSVDYDDSNSSSCKARLATLNKCQKIFSEKDCLLIPS